MSDTEKTPSSPMLIDEHTGRRWPHLIVLHGSGVGEIHRVVGNEAIVGRDPAADIRIDHPTVSRRHARVTVVGDGVFIQDLGSTNGTLVGIHTVRGRRLVPDGAVVALGQITMLKLMYSAVLEDVLRRSEHHRVTRDAVTRVASLDYLRAQLRMECAYARRHRSPLALVTFRANDLPGSADENTVDSTMGALAVTIHVATRGEDILARSARDTLIVLLRADADQAVHMAKRVQEEAASTISGAPGTTASQTVSCMVAQLGKTALAMPTKVIKWATRAFSHAEDAAQNPIIRLPDLESPSSFPVPDDR